MPQNIHLGDRGRSLVVAMGCGASTFDGKRFKMRSVVPGSDGSTTPGDDASEHSPRRSWTDDGHTPSSKGSIESWFPLSTKESNRLPAPTSFLIRCEERVLVDRIMDEVEDWRERG